MPPNLPAAPADDEFPQGSWVYPVALALTILMASSQSEVTVPSGRHLDKVGHFLAFGLLGTLVARTQPMRRWWLGAVAASLFGLVDEGVQSFTPGRFVEVADMVADAAGAVLAVVLYRHWTWYRRVLETPLFTRARGRLRS
jgi:VanZ family protein